MPTEANPAEKRLHALTHLPHRDWCEVCVKARGKDTAHQQKEDIARIAENVDGLEVVELDYTYMEDLKILTLYACAHHGGAATAVERKGPYPWIVAWIVKRLNSMGILDLRLRTDPEESITALARHVKAAWKHRMFLEKTAELLPTNLLEGLNDSTARSRTRFGQSRSSASRV